MDNLVIRLVILFISLIITDAWFVWANQTYSRQKVCRQLRREEEVLIVVFLWGGVVFLITLLSLVYDLVRITMEPF